MQNNTKIRYFVGISIDGNIEIFVDGYSNYKDALNKLYEFQNESREKPYYVSDLQLLDVFSKRTEITFTKFYRPKYEK